MVCRGCGEVQAERVADERAEWRTFEDSKDDPSRVGGAIDSVASRIWGVQASASGPGKGKVGAGAGKKRKAGAAGVGTGPSGGELVNKKSRAQQKLEAVCMQLSDTVRALHLDERVTQVGFTIADSAATEGAFRGRDETLVVAAVLYLACKHCGILKSIAEVCLHMGVNKYEVGRVINDVSRRVKELQAVVFTPEEVVDKYAAQLQLPVPVRTAAVEVVARARASDLEGVHPQTLAGAALLLLCNTKALEDGEDVLVEAPLPGEQQQQQQQGKGEADEDEEGKPEPPPQRSLEEILGVTLMSADALKRAHRQLYDRRRQLVPHAFVAALEANGLALRETRELAASAAAAAAASEAR